MGEMVLKRSGDIVDTESIVFFSTSLSESNSLSNMSCLYFCKFESVGLKIVY